MLNGLQMNFQDDVSDISLTAEEVKYYISSGKDTAPGPDGVRKAHLMQLDDAGIEKLMKVYNTSFE